MNRKKGIAAKEADSPVSEPLRNFMQVPPMPRPIPAPAAKQAQDQPETQEEKKTGV